MSKEITLPAIPSTNAIMIDELLRVLNVPRNVLASDEEIAHAWHGLPRQLRNVPTQYRNQLMARMCVAVQTGLFDSALNYVWNICITALRDRVRHFGLPAVSQVIDKPFDEERMLDLRDAELLELCLNLNLITEDGFFFLNQNRDMRNNFSAAHPTIGVLNDTELLAFLNRTILHALSGESNPRGVDLQGLIRAIQADRFNPEQMAYWENSIRETHEAQRHTIFSTVHGIYCDPTVKEYARLNAADLSRLLTGFLTPKIESALIDRHSEYNAKGDTARHLASRNFFTELGKLGLLTESERHSIVTGHAKRLLAVHQDLNNFYNEPPFAEQLCTVVLQAEVPTTAKHAYVTTAVACYIGNGYGVCRAGLRFYEQMIKAFSSREIVCMLEAARDKKSLIGNRISNSRVCFVNFAKAVLLLDFKSIPTSFQADYTYWVKEAESLNVL